MSINFRSKFFIALTTITKQIYLFLFKLLLWITTNLALWIRIKRSYNLNISKIKTFWRKTVRHSASQCSAHWDQTIRQSDLQIWYELPRFNKGFFQYLVMYPKMIEKISRNNLYIRTSEKLKCDFIWDFTPMCRVTSRKHQCLKKKTGYTVATIYCYIF